MTFTFGDESAAAPPGTFARAAGSRARLSQRRRRAGADVRHPRARRLRRAHRPGLAIGCATVPRSLSSHPGEVEGGRLPEVRPRRLWMIPATAGLLMFVCGLVVLLVPRDSLLTVAVLVGVFLIVVGLLRLAAAFALPEPDSGRLMPALVALLTIAAGIVVIARPGGTALGVAIVLGGWLIATGLIDLVRAWLSGERRGRTALLALIDLAVGILLVAWPDIALATVVVIAGIYLLWGGLLQLLVGLSLRRLERRLA